MHSNSQSITSYAASAHHSEYAPTKCGPALHASTLADPCPVNKKSTTISCLPNDILLLVISYIHVKDILALRKTSKRFYSLTKLRWVWSDASKRHVIDKGLPFPAADVDVKMLSAEHLEARTIHAAKFHDNWNFKKPVARQTVQFPVEYPSADDPPEPQHVCAVEQVVFLPGRNGEFLITLAGGIITCWEVPLDGSEAYLFAEHRELCGIKIMQFIVNEDPKHDVQLAYFIQDDQRGIALVRTLSLDMFHGRFKVRSSMPGFKSQCSPLHAMYGDNIVMGSPLHVWHSSASVIAGRKPVLCLPLSPVQDASGNVLTAKLIGKYILSVREHAIELFIVPAWSDEDNEFEKIRPLNAFLHNDFEAREAVIVARPQDCSGYYGWPSDPVTVLLRCSDDGFETIKQYDLLPNPRVQTVRRMTGETDELPCKFPADYAREISIAPSCSGLRASQSGKGLWIETCNVGRSRHCTYPARCLRGFDVGRAQGGDAGAGEEGGASKAEGKFQAKNRTPENAMHVCEGVLYARRCSMNDVMWRKYAIVSADLEDTVGRVAVGDRDGKVVVLDYA